MKKVCLDPGHVGFDSGAVNHATGLREADVTLAVTFKLASYLAKAGITVVYTRTTPKIEPRPASLTADLAARCKLANEAKADLFVSIHCNSHANPAARGFEVYTSRGQTKADAAAEAIIKAWEATFAQPVVRKDLSDGDSDKEAGFYVLVHTKMPAVLVELAFISNPEEEKLLRDPAFQDKAARAIAEGIASYFGVRLHSEQAASPQAGTTPPKAPMLKINGKVRTDIPFTIIGGRTYVELASFARVCGGLARWNEATRTIEVEMPIGFS